jgi:hypothetical protein|tara:strand:+ start:192 stop:554 length:363 start_codon:yes stop_codon:yes gene_type:complete
MGLVCRFLSGFHARQQQQFLGSIHFTPTARDCYVHPFALKTLRTVVLLGGQPCRTGAFNLLDVGPTFPNDKSNQLGGDWKTLAQHRRSFVLLPLRLGLIHQFVHLEVIVVHVHSIGKVLS